MDIHLHSFEQTIIYSIVNKILVNSYKYEFFFYNPDNYGNIHRHFCCAILNCMDIMLKYYYRVIKYEIG